jgi:U3 small nucleolar RNA-associated protein 21
MPLGFCGETRESNLSKTQLITTHLFAAGGGNFSRIIPFLCDNNKQRLLSILASRFFFYNMSIEKRKAIAQPVSSDSSDDDQSSSDEADTTLANTTKMSSPGSSRLFTPYRLVGLVSSGAGFSFIPHQNSQTSMICVPIEDRFQLMQTDKLQPVLMGQAVATPPITHNVADASMSITVVAHGKGSITLFQRTKAIATVSLEGKIEDLLHLGRMPVARAEIGKDENAAIIVVILSNCKHQDNANETNSSSSSDDESIVSEGGRTFVGQVVVLVATRTILRIDRRIQLPEAFIPVVATHPSTYVNKIVVGGSQNGRSAMLLLNVRSQTVIHEFVCLRNTRCRSITTLQQSPAIDTIAVGTDQGLVHLVNLRHDKVLFSLSHFGHDSKTVTITSISFRDDASAVNYGIAPMAVGRSDGSITIWDLTPPEEPNAGRAILCTLDRVHSPGGVAKLQYMPQEPLLISSGTQSNAVLMHIFDNPDHSGRLLRKRRGHTGSPCRINYLYGNGITANSVDGTDARSCQLLSSGGPDRTLRVFSTARSVLDKEYSQGAGLEKKARTLGLDSQADLLLPPVTAMALGEARRRDWGDLVTIHKNHAFAYVWSTRRGAQSGPLLRQPDWNISARKKAPPPECHATAVAISSCGNMVLVGTRGGTIYKYNIQSGLPRGTYPAVKEALGPTRKKFISGDINRTMRVMQKEMKGNHRGSANLDKRQKDMENELKREKYIQEKTKQASHLGFAVTGLAVDSVNKTVISVGSDSKLTLWNFATHAPHTKSPFVLPSPATKLAHVRDSDLAAIAMEDMSVVLFDCTALSVVRRFAKHSGPVSDLDFSPDGRIMYTSSLDGTVRVYDVPTATCIDWLGFKAAPTSLAVSPTGEYIATTHDGKVGISVWSDRSYYQRVNTIGLALEKPFLMDEPTPISEETGIILAADDSNLSLPAGEAESIEDQEAGPVSAKEKGLITLSGLPPAHWKNLFHLELVKERNKPKEPPKKPPSAPFFLQWRGGEAIDMAPAASEPIQGDAGKEAGDTWASAWTDDDEGQVIEVGAPTDKESFKASDSNKRRKVTHYRSKLASLLQECSSKGSFQDVSDYIATCGPSSIDLALSSLCNGMHDLDEGLQLLTLAAQWLLEVSQSRERCEAVNAYIHRFLHVHTEVIAQLDTYKRDDVHDDSYMKEEGSVKQYDVLLQAIGQLKKSQHEASLVIRTQMQHSLCLLRHLSRMT